MNADSSKTDQTLTMQHTANVESESITVSSVPEVTVEIEITNPSNNEADASEEKRINTKALNGLRGIMAIYVMVFHSLFFCEWEIDILGYVPMTIFILISGFVLALNDGKRIYSATKCCTELCPDKEDKSKFDGKNFYQRRCARIIPLFWLTNLLAIPLFLLNNSFDR